MTERENVPQAVNLNERWPLFLKQAKCVILPAIGERLWGSNLWGTTCVSKMWSREMWTPFVCGSNANQFPYKGPTQRCFHFWSFFLPECRKRETSEHFTPVFGPTGFWLPWNVSVLSRKKMQFWIRWMLNSCAQQENARKMSFRPICRKSSLSVRNETGREDLLVFALEKFQELGASRLGPRNLLSAPDPGGEVLALRVWFLFHFHMEHFGIIFRKEMNKKKKKMTAWGSPDSAIVKRTTSLNLKPALIWPLSLIIDCDYQWHLQVAYMQSCTCVGQWTQLWDFTFGQFISTQVQIKTAILGPFRGWKTVYPKENNQTKFCCKGAERLAWSQAYPSVSNTPKKEISHKKGRNDRQEEKSCSLFPPCAPGASNFQIFQSIHIQLCPPGLACSVFARNAGQAILRVQAVFSQYCLLIFTPSSKNFKTKIPPCSTLQISPPNDHF